jgi:hypothetical protein
MNTALGKSLSVLHTLKHGGTCRFSCESPPPSEKAPSKSKKTCDHLDEIKTPKESSAHASRDPDGPMLPAAGKKRKTAPSKEEHEKTKKQMQEVRRHMLHER